MRILYPFIGREQKISTPDRKQSPRISRSYKPSHHSYVQEHRLQSIRGNPLHAGYRLFVLLYLLV